MANKFELTWVGKDEPIRINPRLLIELPELSNTAAAAVAIVLEIVVIFELPNKFSTLGNGAPEPRRTARLHPARRILSSKSKGNCEVSKLVK